MQAIEAEAMIINSGKGKQSYSTLCFYAKGGERDITKKDSRLIFRSKDMSRSDQACY